MRVYAFTCGWLTMSFGSFLEGEKGRLRVPVPAYLVEHPKGRLLFDSGMHRDAGRDPAGRLQHIAKFSEVHFEPDEAIASRLAAVDVDAGAIDLLVNSHLHFDHAGGNEAIPNASLMVQRREWAAAHDPNLIASNGYLSHDYDHGHSLKLLDGEHDVFGDGSVVCVPTYGHTPGHQALQLRTAQGEMLLCGDACYLRRNLDELRLPRIVHDTAQMMESLLRIRALRDRGVKLYFGHDPEFWQTVPQAPVRIA